MKAILLGGEEEDLKKAKELNVGFEYKIFVNPSNSKKVMMGLVGCAIDQNDLIVCDNLIKEPKIKNILYQILEDYEIED